MTSSCFPNTCCSAPEITIPDRTTIPYPATAEAPKEGGDTDEQPQDSRSSGTWFAGASRDRSRDKDSEPRTSSSWFGGQSRDRSREGGSVPGTPSNSRRGSGSSLFPGSRRGSNSEVLGGGRRGSQGSLLPPVPEAQVSESNPKAHSHLESFTSTLGQVKEGLASSLGGSAHKATSTSGSSRAGGSFNGRWADGTHVHTMEGSTIYWADGTSTEIEDTAPGGFSTTLWGTAYHALLDKTTQVIHWNDGSDWLRLDEHEESLEGFWRAEGEAKSQRHFIRGTTLYWSDGSTTEIQETSPGLFKMNRGSQRFYCRFEHCGQRLKWSDGDSWVRVGRKRTGISNRRMRLVLLCVGGAVAFNVLYIFGISLLLHRDWVAYPAEPQHPSLSWPQAQVWQFAAAWASVPLLLVHGVWATFLAVNSDASESQTLDLEAGSRRKPAMLWMLEPMRLVALLHIVFYHEDPTDPVGRWGFTWITFFMLLAGFVGSYQLLMHDPDISKTTVAGHVWKRVKRLWPLYLLYIFVVSIPDYFEGSLWQGTIIPTWGGTVDAVRTLCSWIGLLYITGLQTLIPLDPHFNFVARTCWFVPTLLLCEAFLPLWLRGIHALLDLAAKRVAEKEGLLGKVEPSRVLNASLVLCAIAGLITAANSACIAFGKVFLRMRAFPDSDLSDAIFWFLRFTPLGHWAQVLLGAVLAKAFLIMQSSDPDGSDEETGDADGCCPEEVVPLSPPMRNVTRMIARGADEADGKEVSCLSRLHQVWLCWPWLLGAACAGCLACLAVHIGTDGESNSTVLFMNCGAPAISFGALVLCLAQASLEIEPHWLTRKIVQALGAVCFPAYLFVSMSQQFVWHYCTLVLSPDASIAVSTWLRVPFLILVQQLWELASAKVCAQLK